MASGRMEFHAQSIMQHANFTFVLPNDAWMDDVKDWSHYERDTKSLILLHGLTGTDTDWLYGGVAQDVAMQYNLAVFMPTTGNSFYLDRGYEGGNFGTFVGEELPEYIHQVFGFCESRENTLIAGLSMGGYGAIHTALAFPERFSGCVALSSALVLKEMAERFGQHGGKGSCSEAGAGLPQDNPDDVMPMAMVRDLFGDPAHILESDKNPEVQIRSLQAAGKEIPKLYLAVGTEDDLLEPNRDFNRFLTAAKAGQTYEEGPGAHNWEFWNEYIHRGLKIILDD